eukprot:148050-Pleurochrysis_carterae.AAC.2
MPPNTQPCHLFSLHLQQRWSPANGLFSRPPVLGRFWPLEHFIIGDSCALPQFMPSSEADSKLIGSSQCAFDVYLSALTRLSNCAARCESPLRACGAQWTLFQDLGDDFNAEVRRPPVYSHCHMERADA